MHYREYILARFIIYTHAGSLQNIKPIWSATMTSKSKPVGGFPSIKTAVETLLDQGMSKEEIMKTLNITKIQFRSASKFTTHLTLPNDLASALEPYAKARQIPVSVLVRYIIEIIVNDNIVESILDDEGDTAVIKQSKQIRNAFIREHFKKDMRAKDLAKMFNITAAHVSALYLGRKMKNGKTTSS